MAGEAASLWQSQVLPKISRNLLLVFWHSEGNPGPDEIEGIVELRPALHTKEWHEALAGLVADGKTTSRGAPRNPLQLGATFWHFRHESRVTSPPIWIQNLMLPPLWALAKLFGTRPYYDHWDSQI